MLQRTIIINPYVFIKHRLTLHFLNTLSIFGWHSQLEGLFLRGILIYFFLTQSTNYDEIVRSANFFFSNQQTRDIRNVFAFKTPFRQGLIYVIDPAFICNRSPVFFSIGDFIILMLFGFYCLWFQAWWWCIPK